MGKRTGALSERLLRVLVQSAHPCFLGATHHLRYRPSPQIYGKGHYVLLRAQYLRLIHRKRLHQQISETKGLPEFVFRIEVTIAVSLLSVPCRGTTCILRGYTMYLTVVRLVPHEGTTRTLPWYIAYQGMICSGIPNLLFFFPSFSGK